jgi:signal transduction histidine kinase
MSTKNTQTVLSPVTAHKFEIIGRIASGLAHDLNGPIGIAMGFSELAKEVIDGGSQPGLNPVSTRSQPGLNPADTSKIRGYLDMIETASLRGRGLTREISNFAKVEPGTTTNVDMFELMQKVQLLTAPAVKSGQVDVAQREIASGAGEIVAYADMALCQLILIELILESPSSIPGGGLVIWQVSDIDGESVQVDLTAEPWNEEPTYEWEVPEYVRESFKDMGGGITSASPVTVDSSTGDTNPKLTGWKVVATLPAAKPG